MPPKPPKTRSLSQAVLPLAKTPQFYWYLGHCFSVISFILSLFWGFFSPGKSLSYYRYTLFFELISYGITIKQAHGKRKVNKIQFLKDENVQYFIFALILYTASFILGPLSGALYSYVIFSVFHAVTYFQTHLLDALPISLNLQAAINSRISFITTNYNQQALFFASAAEVMILSNFLWSIPGLIFQVFRNPLLVAAKLGIFAASVVFVKLRYNDNQYTKTVVQQFDSRISGFLANPMVPPLLSRLYHATLKDLIVKYVGPIRVPVASVAKKSE